jgi:hypothetical protein
MHLVAIGSSLLRWMVIIGAAKPRLARAVLK